MAERYTVGYAFDVLVEGVDFDDVIDNARKAYPDYDIVFLEYEDEDA